MVRVTSPSRRLAGRWGRFGITTRLMAGYSVIISAVIAAVVYQSDLAIGQRLQTALSTDLSDETHEFSATAASRPQSQSLQAFTADWLSKHGNSRVNLLVSLHSPDGGSGPALTEPGAAWMASVPRIAGWIHRSPAVPVTLTVRTARGTYKIRGGPLVVAGHQVGMYVAAASLDVINTDRNDQLALAALEGLLALLAAIGGGYLLLRRALRTVTKVTQAADEARRGDLAQRLSYEGPNDEVGRLARTVDAMLTQLDVSFAAQRRLLADVSHQLRTPLTVARGHLEVLARNDDLDGEQAETVALVVDELTQMSLMVERLLLLGQAMEPDFLLEEEVELATLLNDVSEAARVMAPRNWVLGALPEITIYVDRAKLRGALLNLIDNAVKATDEHGTIEISVALDGEIVIAVADDGRGISPDDQRRVFDRFRRYADNSYGGSGLGLAIVKAVAEAHGGRVELASAIGKGCRVAVVLPHARILAAPPPRAETGEVR